MNNRGLKRRRILYRRKNAQRTMPSRLILTPEDKEWLNMSPVGREFGSPDFEKLDAADKPD